MKKLTSILFLFLTLFQKDFAQKDPVVLIGGTIIDFANFGNSTKDMKNSLVVFQNGKIIYSGKYDKTKIPTKAQLINVKGKFVVPGLIDGFAILNSQTQANAYLYMGVTTVVGGIDSSFRGNNFLKANPSPKLERMYWVDQLYDVDDTSYMKETNADIEKVSQMIDKLDSIKQAGYSIAFLHHRFPSAMYDKVVAKAKLLHMATIGEMQYASYRAAMEKGVQSFVHTLRFSLEPYPAAQRDTFIHYPSKQGIFFNWYADIKNRKSDTALWRWAKDLSRSKTALMPTVSMIYAMYEHHDNLWQEPVAAILDSTEIHIPMNKQTGFWTDDQQTWKDAKADSAITAIYVKAGCHFLTGSGTDAFGSMPGISEHMEIKLLHDLGLTKRQAIAAATNNFSIFFNWKERGLIEEGRLADILVLSYNPLNDLNNLKNIELLFLNGQSIDRSALLRK